MNWVWDFQRPGYIAFGRSIEAGLDRTPSVSIGLIPRPSLHFFCSNSAVQYN